MIRTHTGYALTRTRQGRFTARPSVLAIGDQHDCEYRSDCESSWLFEGDRHG
jgi:hypothetical protein